MNYIWMELRRQRNALARLMLGSLPREEAGAQTAAPMEEFAAPAAEPGRPALEQEMGRMAAFPLAESDWTADLVWEGSGAVSPLRPGGRQSAAGWEDAGHGDVLSERMTQTGAASVPVPAGMQPGLRMAEFGSGGGAAPAEEAQSCFGQMSTAAGAAAEPRFAGGNPAAWSRVVRASTPDAPQIRMVTELTEPQVRSSWADPAALSRAFERDARRYDGGFELYP